MNLPGNIDEGDLLLKNGCKQLKQVKELWLSGHSLETLDEHIGILERLPVLQMLDVSNNQLQSFPARVTFRQLLKLDISGNRFETLDFLEQCPNLVELKCDGNNLDICEKYKAIVICMQLDKIDGDSVDKMAKLIQGLRDSYVHEVHNIWKEYFVDKYEKRIPEKLISTVTNELEKKATEAKNCGSHLERFRKFLLRKLCEELVNDVQSGNYQPPSKRRKIFLSATPPRRVTPRRHSLSDIRRKQKRGNETTPTKKPKSVTPLNAKTIPGKSTFTILNTKQSLNNVIKNDATPTTKPKSVTPLRIKTTPGRSSFTAVNSKPTKLPVINDYDPTHFIRCHFGDREARRQGHADNDPTDDVTRIWQCAFEPHSDNPSANTGVVATCGGNIVCLIDCSTGVVMKRYKQAREEFYALAWTTLLLDTEAGEKASNILAIGGYDAHIKLVHPAQMICYKELGNGRPNRAVPQGHYYCTGLLFHPHSSTWLFNSASDGTITLWDIGVPRQTGSKYDVNCSQLTVFHSPGGAIMTTVLSVPTNHLIADCAEGIFAWSVPQDAEVKRRNAHLELEMFTEIQEGRIDGIVMVDDHHLACKYLLGGFIEIFHLTSALSKRRPENKMTLLQMEPVLRLLWKDCKVDYISMGAHDGFLSCGDHEGSVWLYDVTNILKQQQQATCDKDELLPPSRVLEWPECDIDSTKTNEQQMTDVKDSDDILVVNCVKTSYDRRYIVCGTDSNMVCIWKRCSE